MCCKLNNTDFRFQLTTEMLNVQKHDAQMSSRYHSSILTQMKANKWTCVTPKRPSIYIL